MRPVSAWWSRLREAAPPAGDAVLALAVLAVALAQMLAQPPSDYRPADPLGAALLALICAPLVFRSRAARAVLVATHVAAAAYVLLGYPQAVLGIPLVIAVYTVGTRHDPRASAGVIVLMTALLTVAFATDR